MIESIIDFANSVRAEDGIVWLVNLFLMFSIAFTWFSTSKRFSEIRKEQAIERERCDDKIASLDAKRDEERKDFLSKIDSWINSSRKYEESAMNELFRFFELTLNKDSSGGACDKDKDTSSSRGNHR